MFTVIINNKFHGSHFFLKWGKTWTMSCRCLQIDKICFVGDVNKSISWCKHYFHHYVWPKTELPSLNRSFWQAVNAYAPQTFTIWLTKKEWSIECSKFWTVSPCIVTFDKTFVRYIHVVYLGPHSIICSNLGKPVVASLSLRGWS